MRRRYYSTLGTICLAGGIFAQGYSPITNSGIIGVNECSIAKGDVDGDGDTDLFLTGSTNNSTYSSTLYLNQGNGTFMASSGQPFVDVRYGDADFADLDGDGDLDILLVGQASGSTPVSGVYLNDGSGNYTEQQNTGVPGFVECHIALADHDGDGDIDALITGISPGAATVYTRMYNNDGNGVFTYTTASTAVAQTHEGDVAFLDVDNDGDQDALITGRAYVSGNTVFCNLYINTGAGTYNLSSQPAMVGVHESSIVKGDFNNDGFVDVIVGGSNTSTWDVRMYINDGTGQLILHSTSPFEGVVYSGFDAADIDNDGDLDLLITGNKMGSPSRITEIYVNDGALSFSPLPGASSLEDVGQSCAMFLDHNNDGVQDVYVSGVNPSNQRVGELYEGCLPKAVTQVETSCGPFTWIDGNTYTSSLLGQTYVKSGPANGCDTTFTLNLTVNTVDTQVAASNNTISSSATGAVFQWIDCDNQVALVGETGASFTALANGNYAVEVTQNGCADTSACVSITTVGIEDRWSQDVLAWYNAKESKVMVSLPEESNVEVEVFTFEGKLIAKKVSTGMEQIAINLTPDSGIFLVHIRGEKGTRVVKLSTIR